MLLLDTSVVIFLGANSGKISGSALSAITDPSERVWISVVSIWEMHTKVRLGKLKLGGTVREFLEPLLTSDAVQILDLHADVPHRLAGLPSLHKDPFDLMLICQALHHGLVLVTPDALMRQYPLKTLW